MMIKDTFVANAVKALKEEGIVKSPNWLYAFKIIFLFVCFLMIDFWIIT